MVISADRPAAWIGQTDGQTIPQAGLFKNLVKKSVQLPEPTTQEEEWYCNRLINEALSALEHHGKGPVHINIPLSEPLFNYTAGQLPDVRKITRSLPEKIFSTQKNSFHNRFKEFQRPLIIIGQLLPDTLPEEIPAKLYAQYDCILFAEHLSNIQSKDILHNLDAILYTLPEEKKKELSPDLVVTLGGHIVSKRIKQWLRTYSPREHWHITENGEIADLFQCVTDVIESDAETFLHSLLKEESEEQTTKPWQTYWSQLSASIQEPDCPYSDLYSTGLLCRHLPENSSLHLANSSSVRYAQLFSLPKGIQVYGNRGTSGIEGSVSTAAGYSSVNRHLTFLLIGDLSFFYDMNGLWNEHISPGLRILVNNNSGGEIFYALPGLDKSEALNPYIAGNHQTSAKEWAESRGFIYLSAHNKDDLTKNMLIFVSQNTQQPVLLEVFSSIETNTGIVKRYYHELKQVVGS